MAYNLLPNGSYDLKLTAIHTGSNARTCRYGHCSKTIRLFAGRTIFVSKYVKNFLWYSIELDRFVPAKYEMCMKTLIAKQKLTSS